MVEKQNREKNLTSLSEIDDMIKDLGSGDLVIVGERPGAGTSTTCAMVALRASSREDTLISASLKKQHGHSVQL